jgi:hypothetical protein
MGTTKEETTILRDVQNRIIKMAQNMEKTQIADYIRLMNRPFRLFYLNLLSGVARGIGIALGFTVFAATILIILRWLGALDLPLIGKYIAELVRVVQFQLEGRRY